MTQTRDPAIKLFGQTIPVPESQFPAPNSDFISSIPVNSPVLDVNSEITTERKSGKSIAVNDVKTEDQQIPKDGNETSKSDKVAKRPDKIIPCPRCNSLETKFCYFNNYNVNQPRHFCRNCQRYWTAGGTMRSVPIGAGRKKSNKHIASVPSIGESSTGNGKAVPGSEGPLCESMETGLDLRDPNLGLMQKEVVAGLARSCYPDPPPPPSVRVPVPYWSCLTVPRAGTNNPPTLGKHGREDANMISEEKPEKEILAPKALRIDEVDRGLRSSMWTSSLGLASNQKEGESKSNKRF